MDNPKNILFVVSNISKVAHITTGLWLEEFAVPYLEFKKAGYDICVASPLGGMAPITPTSLPHAKPEWNFAKDILERTESIDDINESDFDAIFIPGGHGPMFDLPQCEKLAEIVSKFYADGKLIGAVCRGSAGLISAKAPNGEPLVKAKHMTACTNEEEKPMNKEELMPFLIENKLKELGANFVALEPNSEHVVVCENLITGQNYQSSKKVAEEMIKFLQSTS